MGQEGKALGEEKRGGGGQGGGRCLFKQVAATPTRVPAWLEEDRSAFCLVRDERQTEADKEGDTKRGRVINHFYQCLLCVAPPSAFYNPQCRPAC